MPTTVSQLFQQAGLSFHGQVEWGKLIKSKECGFYVVAMSDNFSKLSCIGNPTFNDNVIKQWIQVVKSGGKQILIDNKIADLKSIKQRLGGFWLPDETILYIGKAGPKKERTIGKRVNEYYLTIMGCNKPHAGGHWINILEYKSLLNVFYAEYLQPDIEEKEEQLISYFMENVSAATKENLFDKVNCYPFANKELHRKSQRTKITKNHNLTNQTIDCAKKVNIPMFRNVHSDA